MTTQPSGLPFFINELGLKRILRRGRFAVLVALFAVNWQSVTAQVSGQVNVTMYHYDQSGTGQNLNETTLAPGNVNATQFGKLFSYPVDGFVYAQPLYLTGVFVPGRGARNVVFVATEGDSVYAFDADNPDPVTGGGLIWKRTFTNPGMGITTIPTIEVYPNVNFPDIRPQIGITGTPVIQYDPAAGSGTLFVVVKTREVRGTDIHYVHKLQALDVATGADAVLTGGQLIADTTFNGPGNPYVQDPANPCVPGTGDGSQAGQVCFNSLRQLNRPALTLRDGIVWTAFASHGDNGPYHGWILGYRVSDLSLVATFNATPNGGLGGIWQGGAAPVFDAPGNIYVATGNGTFRTDADGTKNYGETILKLSATPGGDGILPVLDSFTPFEQAILNQFDIDQGSGGILLLADQAGPHTHLLVQTGKRGKVYLLDRDNLGGYRHGTGCDQEPVLETCDGVLQFAPNGTVGGGSYGTSAFFNTGLRQFIFYGGNGDTIKALEFNPTMGNINLPAFSESVENFGFTGVTPTISAAGSDNAILWGLDVNGYGIPQKPTPSPVILHAYDANDLSKELYSSAQMGARDQMDNAVKFTTPTVANAHVYVGTQGSVEVFGLFQPSSDLPVPPSNLSAIAGPAAPTPPSIILSWTNNATDATGVEIERSFNGTDFTLLTTVGRNQTTYTDNAVLSSVKYYYRLRAVNQIGESGPSNIAFATTHIGGPILQVSDIFDMQISLSWTATAPTDGHYLIVRSTDGVSFVTVGNVGGNTTQFTDGVPVFGTYFYRVTAFNADNSDHADSNLMSAVVGPVGVTHGGGFADHSDLTPNANTSRSIFMGNVLRLTDGNNSEAGSVFTNSQVGIRKFTTTFTFLARPGTVPMADGLTFIIQSNGPMALGNQGGGMGYQGVQRSVAIKFDLLNHGRGGYSTGLYVDGHNPDAPGSGEANISLVGTGIDLTSGHPIKVDLAYDSTTLSLTETITDTTNNKSFTISSYPPVDISAHVGGDTAFVGFGAGTGGLNAIQDILSWTYTADESGLPPRKPSNLSATKIVEVSPGRFDVTLSWKGNNAYTATGYKLERSTDGTSYMQIAQLPVNQTSFTDTNLTPGGYFYRARSFNALQNSGYTDPLCIPLASGGAIDHSTGFTCHGDLNANGNAIFAGSLARLTDGGGGEAGSIFSLNKIDVRKFTTSFKFQIHTPGSNPMADGMCWVVQGNSPTALGFSGGGLGYGPDTRGGPRGIRNSLCVKFDIYDNQGEGNNSTGLFGDGRSPTLPERDSGDILVDLRETPIDLNSQHVFQVDLTYDGTTLTEKITDTSASQSFSTSYTINIPNAVGGNTAYMGFTGGTGGLTTTQDVQTWTYQPTP